MRTRLEPSEESIPIEGLSRIKSVFSIITFLVVAMLLLLHTIFASIVGKPPIPVVTLLGLALALTISELLWLHARGSRLTQQASRIQTSITITLTFILTALVTYVTNRDENPYFVLLAIPILQCAYTFGLGPTILTITVSDGMIFLWLWHYFGLHPPARITQYFEGWMLSVVYLQMGLLVWFLVNQLKANQLKLSASMKVLEDTRERLISEEKLAAVGRLASGIAHEIRNPVSMISSSLLTAKKTELDEGERKEMYAIAEQESKRLELLTSDFLTFARPSLPVRLPTLLFDLLSYVAAVSKAHAANRGITIALELSREISVDIDSPLVEAALLNLVINAIDATPEGGTIRLGASLEEDIARIDIQNSGFPIPDSTRAQMFEPFFTTKASGTGLGLAIARSAAKAHGGDLWLSDNRNGCVTFSMTLARDAKNDGSAGAEDG